MEITHSDCAEIVALAFALTFWRRTDDTCSLLASYPKNIDAWSVILKRAPIIQEKGQVDVAVCCIDTLKWIHVCLLYSWQ